MKAPKANNSWDLEAIGIIAGLILIICFDVTFIETDSSSIFITIVAGMGDDPKQRPRPFEVPERQEASGIFSFFLRHLECWDGFLRELF